MSPTATSSASTSGPEPSGLEILGPVTGRHAEILSPEARVFLAGLFRAFGARREGLLAARVERQREIEAGKLPDWLPETAHLRAGDWRVPPPPPDLVDRRTEITGPVDRKMVINALNSGAQCYMADFEDATSPTWENVLDGQVNMLDAVRRTISFTNPDGKVYKLNEKTAVLIMRPRGWHLPEKHVLFDGKPVSGSLFDWGLMFFHNARELLARGSGPYFYLPKMESRHEARLWNDVLVHAQEALGLPRGTVRVTMLIETITATFEAEEILYELRDHALGLNCGRWDYMFSCVKRLCHRGELYPDRSQLAMSVRFLDAYTTNVIQICHRRGAYAMGGMAAQIPIKSDPEANAAALERVRADKEREAAKGHDGTWVGHPGLVPIALEAFAKHMPTPEHPAPNQVHRLLEDRTVTREDLLSVPEGTITETGVRTNLGVGVQYVEAWLGGLGCVPIHHLMEDAATAEISRSQLWQWLQFGARLDDGRPITAELYDRLLAEELAKIRRELGAARYDGGHFPAAVELFMGMVRAPKLAEFLTLPAYEMLP